MNKIKIYVVAVVPTYQFVIKLVEWLDVSTLNGVIRFAL